VQSHEKDQEERLALGLAVHEIVPTEQGRHEDTVAEARDGKQFSKSLDEAHDDGLEVRQRGVHDPTLNE